MIRSIAAVLVTASLGVAVGAGVHTPRTTETAQPVGAARALHVDAVKQSSLFSRNWAGYVVNGRTNVVAATFVVPNTTAAPQGYASSWVGIDVDVENGKASYYGWWEVITPSSDAPETEFGTFAVRPGDSITATVRLHSGLSTMALKNNTTGKSSWRTVKYAGPAASGEWIQEAVQVDGRISPSPNWKAITFSHVTRNGRNAQLSYSQSLDIMDSQGVRETVTGRPYTAGNAFTVKRVAAGHWGTA